MSTIKQRRLALLVTCHANDRVGDYVPFYFCARSIMLFVIHCANNPDLTYRGGQAPIVYMQADLQAVVAWARQHNRRWAFSLDRPTSPRVRHAIEVLARGGIRGWRGEWCGIRPMPNPFPDTPALCGPPRRPHQGLPLGSSGPASLRSRGPAVGRFAGQEMKASDAAFDREAAELGRGA